MATIKDIVTYTGLSLGTVSKYLNGGTVKPANRDKIERAVRELGYRYNDLGRSLKTRRSGLIGILIPALTESFSAEIIGRAEEIFAQRAYGTLVCDTMYSEQRERAYVDLFLRKRVDGVIAVPTTDDGRVYARLCDAGVPLVLIDKQLDVPADAYLLDNFAAAYDVARRIRAAGHTRIGMLAGREGLQSADERVAGFTAGLADNGGAELLLERGDYTQKETARLTTERLLAQKPTAVFASNYYYTLSLLSVLNRTGDRPAYVGFDDLHFTELVRPTPSLVTQPMTEYGRLAAEKLLARLEGDDSPHGTVRLPAGFLDNDSLRPI